MPMKIGELAKRTESTVETIRYYEKEGLLPEPSRSDGNYRLYGEEHIERLRFIRHCRTLVMALDEVRTLLRYRDTPTEECGDVHALLDEHIHAEVRKDVVSGKMFVVSEACGGRRSITKNTNIQTKI